MVVVGVFVYLQLVMGSSSSEKATATADEVVNSGGGEVPEKAEVRTNVTEPKADDSTAAAPLVREPIPLSKLPLNDTQKQLVKGLGIDYDTFMITPEMALCAEGSLGRERVGELIDGSSPSFSELTVLTKCL